MAYLLLLLCRTATTDSPIFFKLQANQAKAPTPEAKRVTDESVHGRCLQMLITFSLLVGGQLACRRAYCLCDQVKGRHNADEREESLCTFDLCRIEASMRYRSCDDRLSSGVYYSTIVVI